MLCLKTYANAGLMVTIQLGMPRLLFRKTAASKTMYSMNPLHPATVVPIQIICAGHELGASHALLLADTAEHGAHLAHRHVSPLLEANGRVVPLLRSDGSVDGVREGEAQRTVRREREQNVHHHQVFSGAGDLVDKPTETTKR
jgi:hypothetical protein